jgi:hypothetical protein
MSTKELDKGIEVINNLMLISNSIETAKRLLKKNEELTKKFKLCRCFS